MTFATEICAPVELRRVLFQLRQRHRIVELVEVAKVRLRPGDLRNLRLEREELVRLGRRVRRADHLERALDVRTIGVALLLVLVRQVIVAVRHPHSVRPDEGDVNLRISRIGKRAERIDGRSEIAQRMRHVPGELGLGLDRVDLREVGLERRGVELLEPRLIHVAGVEGAELAILRRAKNDCAQLLLVAIDELGTDPVLRLVGRDLVRIEPLARGVALEIVARPDRRIARGNVDSPRAEMHDLRRGIRRRNIRGCLLRRCRHRLKSAAREQHGSETRRGAERTISHCFAPN